jgi:hypothetical protein
MANLPELNEFTTGIYQIETSDPVLGGVDGITNVPLKALANRTKWLKAQVDALNEAVGDAIDAAYVQAELNKLSYKAPVLAVTTTNITLSGLQTIDGVSLVAGNRVLVRAQSTGSQNGIWLAQTSAWVRADDMNADSEIQPGVAVVVSSGSIYADTIWTLNTDGTITVGSTAQTWKCLTEDTALLGNPTAPTAAQFDDDTSIATTEFVQRALGNTAGFTGVTANTTLTAANAGKIIYASSTTGTITLTLPGAAALKAGAKYEIYNTGVSDVVVQRSGSDTIVVNNTTNTVTSITLKAGDSIELVNLGAGTLWYHAGGTAQLGNATGAPLLGVNQTWQNLTGSRAGSTTYYNTTGRPIAVSIMANGTQASVQIFVNGSVVASPQWGGAPNSSSQSAFTIVPPGANYSATIGGAPLNFWNELR